MELIAQKEETAKELITPRGDAPLKGKTEAREESWKPTETVEKSQEGQDE